MQQAFSLIREHGAGDNDADNDDDDDDDDCCVSVLLLHKVPIKCFLVT